MGISIPTALAIAAAGTAASTIATIATAPGAPKVAPPPQAAKTPDAAGVRNSLAGSAQGGGGPTVAQTFLTGTGGVDPSLLQLGKNTLLGGG